MNATRIVLTMLLAGLAAQSASAQLRYVRPQTNPYGNPTVSPYLNIASGMNPAISYYGIVRPTVQTQQFEQTLIGPGGALTQQVTTTGVRPFVTGGSSTFMAFGGYFNNINGAPLGRPAPPPGYAAPLTPSATPIGGGGGGLFGGGGGGLFGGR